MDWVIRVIEGPDQGLEHLLQPGPSLIGRGKGAALRLSPEDVSWEHTVVTREGGEYYVENLSALGTWVGDARVSGRVRLKPGDRIRLSDQTVLRVQSSGGGGGGTSGLLITAVVVMVAALGAVAYYQLKIGSSRPENWNGAFVALSPWVGQQAARGRIPPAADDLFRNAWRFAEVNDWPDSQKAWMRLQIALASPEARVRCLELAAADPSDKALQGLLSPPPGGASPDDDEYAAALGQFVQRYLLYSKRMVDKGSSVFKPS